MRKNFYNREAQRDFLQAAKQTAVKQIATVSAGSASTMELIMHNTVNTFEHVARAHWPIIQLNGEWDWVASVECMESWLERYVGTDNWCYGSGTSHDYWQVCVAFDLAKHKTLFLLQWT